MLSIVPCKCSKQQSIDIHAINLESLLKVAVLNVLNNLNSGIYFQMTNNLWLLQVSITNLKTSKMC